MSNGITVFLENLDKLFRELEVLTEKREEMLKTTRDILKFSRDVINYSIVGKLDEAREIISKLRNAKERLIDGIADEPRLLYSGSLRDTLKEFVEAELIFNFVVQFNNNRDIRLPNWVDLGVSEETFILGVFDFIGELKRLLLGFLREKKLEKAWRVFEIMREIYNRFEGRTILNSIVPGYKSKVDSIRRLIISTEEFLVKIKNEQDVIRALKCKENELK